MGSVTRNGPSEAEGPETSGQPVRQGAPSCAGGRRDTRHPTGQRHPFPRADKTKGLSAEHPGRPQGKGEWGGGGDTGKRQKAGVEAICE